MDNSRMVTALADGNHKKDQVLQPVEHSTDKAETNKELLGEMAELLAAIIDSIENGQPTNEQLLYGLRLADYLIRLAHTAGHYDPLSLTKYLDTLNKVSFVVPGSLSEVGHALKYFQTTARTALGVDDENAITTIALLNRLGFSGSTLWAYHRQPWDIIDEKPSLGGEKMANDCPVEIDAATGEVETLPPSKGRYRCKLDTMQDVRREMAKVYREARSGLVDVQDATKLTWCLQAVGKVIETSDLEKRIEALEGKV